MFIIFIMNYLVFRPRKFNSTKPVEILYGVAL